LNSFRLFFFREILEKANAGEGTVSLTPLIHDEISLVQDLIAS